MKGAASLKWVETVQKEALIVLADTMPETTPA